MNKKITTAVANLLQKDVTPVFDVDGVLCVYEMGMFHHMAVCNKDWPEYVKTNRPYDTAHPVQQMKAFIYDKGPENVHICSVAYSDEEEAQKQDFITREYGIPVENMRFVRSTEDKKTYLKELAKDKKECQIALIEDTLKTIDDIYETTDFLTLHVSSFFSYPTFGNYESICEQLKQQAYQYRRRAKELEKGAPAIRCWDYEKLESKACSYEHALDIVQNKTY